VRYAIRATQHALLNTQYEMAINTVIMEGLNTIFLALTPVERWQAARRFSIDITAHEWLVLITVTALPMLIALLFWVSYRRLVEERKIAQKRFADNADKIGLSERERQILLKVVSRSGLKRSDAIFSMEDAFDRGASKLIEESLATQTTEETEGLRAELSFLRQKLGFQDQPTWSVGTAAKPKKLNSRQIPVGKKVHMTPQTSRLSDSIESTVIENNDMELVVKLATPVKITFGELWLLRYYFGSSVWEFDTSVISYDGDMLVLNHSDNVRLTIRRRFLRVAVERPALVAHFPFTRTLPPKIDSGGRKPKAKQGSTVADRICWGIPEFVPAVVTELAGPGLRIEAPLDVKIGDRVLAIFQLDEGDKDSSIVEDIGLVRHTKATENGFSIAVELIGLSDSDVDELIRAANTASARAGTKEQDGDGTGSASDEQASEEEAAEPAATQGV